MSISSANIRYYLSGGVGNSTPDLSLGGDRASSTVPVNLFSKVIGEKAVVGDVAYRCIYVRNEDSDPDGWIDPVAWIYAETPSPDTDVAIGLDPAGKNGTPAQLPDELTAPSGVVFSAPSSKGAGLALPSGPYLLGESIAIWIRRTVLPGASSTPIDSAIIRVEGDTV